MKIMKTDNFFHDPDRDYDWSEPSNESYMFSGPGDEEREDSEDEEEVHHDDWGEVDPLENDSPFHDPMDPSGPGSAV